MSNATTTVREVLLGAPLPALSDAAWWSEIQRYSLKSEPVFSWQAYTAVVPEAGELLAHYQTEQWGACVLDGIIAAGIYGLTADPQHTFKSMMHMSGSRSRTRVHCATFKVSSDRSQELHGLASYTVDASGEHLSMTYWPLEDPEPGEADAHRLKMILHEGRHHMQRFFAPGLFARTNYPEALRDGGELEEIDACLFSNLVYALYAQAKDQVMEFVLANDLITIPGRPYFARVPDQKFGKRPPEASLLAQTALSLPCEKEPLLVQPACAIHRHARWLTAAFAFFTAESGEARQAHLELRRTLPPATNGPEQLINLELQADCLLQIGETERSAEHAREAAHLYTLLFNSTNNQRYFKYLGQSAEALGVIERNDRLVDLGQTLFIDQYVLRFMHYLLEGVKLEPFNFTRRERFFWRTPKAGWRRWFARRGWARTAVRLFDEADRDGGGPGSLRQLVRSTMRETGFANDAAYGLLLLNRHLKTFRQLPDAALVGVRHVLTDLLGVAFEMAAYDDDIHSLLPTQRIIDYHPFLSCHGASLHNWEPISVPRKSRTNWSIFVRFVAGNLYGTSKNSDGLDSAMTKVTEKTLEEVLSLIQGGSSHPSSRMQDQFPNFGELLASLVMNACGADWGQEYRTRMARFYSLCLFVSKEASIPLDNDPILLWDGGIYASTGLGKKVIRQVDRASLAKILQLSACFRPVNRYIRDVWPSSGALCKIARFIADYVR